MNANTEISLDQLHQHIIDAITTQFPSLITIEAYQEDRKNIRIPACFIELSDMEPDPEADPGTGQLAVLARFEARLLIGFKTQKAKIEIRKLAGAFAAFIHQKRFGLPVGSAEVISIEPDNFSPTLDQYEIWRVEWQHSLHLGESVWKNDGTIPETVFVGFAPDIGPENVSKYQQVYP